MDQETKGKVIVALVVFAGGIVYSVATRRSHVAPQSSQPAPARVVEAADAGAVEIHPVPAGDLRRLARFDASLYSSGKGSRRADVLALPATKPFAVVDTPPASVTVPTFALLEPTIAEVPPPSLDQLERFAPTLSASERRAMSQAKSVTVLSFMLPIADGFARYHDALKVLGDAAAKTDAFLWDQSTRQALSRAAWSARLDDWSDGTPPLARHVTIHAYRKGELIRLVTLGMEKFGLPDVALNDVSDHDQESGASLIMLTCQTLAERGKLERDGVLDVSIDGLRSKTASQPLQDSLAKGATGKATLTLSMGTPDEGDADNRLVEIVFPGPKSGLQIRRGQLLASLFGSVEKVVQAKTDDEELLAASRRMKAALLKLKPQWNGKRPELESLIVKGPFRTASGGTEWMWVEVTGWSGATIHGLLQNDPYEVPGLKQGALVDVAEDSVFDYMLRKADGTTEGGETIAILQKQAH